MAKVEVNTESLVTILNQVQENIKEERGLALERYKRQDENLDTDEQFALQGKILCDLLKIAAERSNTLMNMGRMIASIIYKDNNIESSGSVSDDEIKREIQRQLNEEMNGMNTADFPDKENKK